MCRSIQTFHSPQTLPVFDHHLKVSTAGSEGILRQIKHEFNSHRWYNLLSDHVVQQIQSFLVRMMEEFGNIWKQKACLLDLAIEGSDYGNKGVEFL